MIFYEEIKKLQKFLQLLYLVILKFCLIIGRTGCFSDRDYAIRLPR